jgi:hypothetical protein
MNESDADGANDADEGQGNHAEPIAFAKPSDLI